MPEKLTKKQEGVLRLVVETHNGCKINAHMARALERRGFVEPPPSGDIRFPYATAAGVAYVEALR